ncbi:ABC transporter permease [Lacticaseibacillus suibinensis]|uniref:ABC transporter permease n=1 Tax=Lacticaseibacillus suibinensis TaxID=2486011 RepID=UPI000F78185F|nr:ABC transporter permease [Lacticaseibacillus suibinensis]
MRKLNLIAKMVFRKNMRSFSWWSLVLMPLIALAIIGGISWYMDQTNQPAQVAVAAPAAVQASLKHSSDPKFQAVTSVAAGQKLLKASKVDGLLTVAQATSPSVKLVVRDDGETVDPATIKTTLTALNTQAVAKSLGLSQAALAQMLRPTQVKVKTVTVSGGHLKAAANKSEGLKSILALAVGFLMYLFLMSYGSIVAQEIATEKGSRIEESILAAIKAQTQFYGKLLGIAELVGVQLSAYAVLGGGAWLLRKHWPALDDLLRLVDWQQIGWSFVLVMLGFFVLGILSYTILAALCGSLVSNQEQAGMALQPVLYLAMIGYFAALMVSNGSGPIINVMSYLPFLSPMIMPARYGVDQVGLLQVGIALAINLVFLLGFSMFAARAYRANVLVYSDSGILAALKKSRSVAKAQR